MEKFRVRYNQAAVKEVKDLLKNLELNTVCNEASCPNMGECYKRRTATFMILGKQCTRNCRFCNVITGKPEAVNIEEPTHVAEAVQKLDLKHVVITSVTRDDLSDGGASQFAACIRKIRQICPQTSVEVLIPDFKGNLESLQTVIDAKPDIINHNLETVKELYSTVRPQAIYERSLAVLSRIKEEDDEILTKSGIMVGLGETKEQVLALLEDAKTAQCDIMTIGQYLQPSSSHLPVKEYVERETYRIYERAGLKMGFRTMICDPLVRSSYRAEEVLSHGGR